MAKDVDLFKAAMAGVRPLKGQRRAAAPKAKAAAVPPPSPQKSFSPADAAQFQARQTFDRDIDRALSRGKRAPEAKLDLHGMTLAAAERAVSEFLAESSEHGRRLVLIVTGKGLRLEGGRVF